jgi:ribosomal protein S18 acetylase RimI-like enzyme
MKLVFRHDVSSSDRGAVRDITASTGFFNDEEVLISVELVDEALLKGEASGYIFLVCEDGSGKILGYTCYGPVPGTKESFDLYWIVVSREHQGEGIGRRLLAKTEKDIARRGGARIYAETSSRELYMRTRAFYITSGYVHEASLKDFYAPGDSKIIYVKQLVKKPF